MQASRTSTPESSSYCSLQGNGSEDGRAAAALACHVAGSGPDVLFIHGAGSDGTVWASDLAALTSTHRVITYNRRGYPLSGPPTTDWRVHGADAARLIGALAAAPVAVVAHSAGSIGALDLATRHPDLVARLVLLDPAFRARRHVSAGLALTFLRVLLLRRVSRERAAVDAWLRYGYSYATGGSAFDRMPETRRDAVRANARAIFADISAGDGGHISDEELGGLSVPVTIIVGELSPPFLQGSAASLAQLVPLARLQTLKGAGHAMAFDQPDALIGLVRTALDD
jgi:pimeloyl-ACP methyl ester carboxylesterase